MKTEPQWVAKYIDRKRWKTNGKRTDREGNPITFHLKTKDIRFLLEEAGIEYTDVGVGADKYCLARDNDLGSYTIGNCRFITNRENNRDAVRIRAGG